MKVSMLSWKCKEGHQVTHIQIGVDKDGDFWLNWECEKCGVEIIVQVDMDEVKQLGLAHLQKEEAENEVKANGFTAKDLNFLMALRIKDEEDLGGSD